MSIRQSTTSRPGLVSAAFFCPQARAPDREYLAGVHAFLAQDPRGREFLKEIAALKTNRVWDVYAEARDDIAALSHGPEYVDMLHDWAIRGDGESLAAVRSGIVALPLLLIVQITQYLRYLSHHSVSHQDFVAGVGEGGGLQGYCGGLPAAMAIGSAQDEEEVVKHAATAVRILLGIGAYGEAADKTGDTGSTTLALRLKYEGQGDDLTRRFPGTHVSAITEPRSVSIVGPAGQLHELFCFARGEEGLQVQKMEVRGQVHNPDNGQISKELCALCRDRPGAALQLPDAAKLKVRVRSNRTGEPLDTGPLTDELVTTILASRCEWYTLLGNVAQDLEARGGAEAEQANLKLVYFGLTDCVPLTPFHRRGLRPEKTAAHPLIQRRVWFQDDAVAVVGASCRLPGANSIDELWGLLAAGADCHRELGADRFDLAASFRAGQSGSFAAGRKFYGNLIDDVSRFDNGFFRVNPREALNMDPQQRILLELSYEALESSGYLATHRREDGDDVGCFIGASFVEYLDNTSAHPPTAYTSTGTIRAFLCGRLSYYYGWSGPSEVIDTACSSSLVAINRACRAVRSGECRMALTGGINIIAGVNNYLDLARAGFLSPTGQCKPFDAAADGYCRSDGAGLVVLKRLRDAVADGDAVLGVIPGVATNQGGLSASITVPHSTAQQALYRNVLQQARLSPESVTYVETHGTGTQAGDPLEVESIRSVFSRRSTNNNNNNTLHIGSIKGNIGHCETAAGVAGLLKVLAMLKHGQLPPQANHQSLNPNIPPLEPDGMAITRDVRPWNAPLRAALVNSYGAAGSNCALVCCGYDSPAPLAVKAIRQDATPGSTDTQLATPSIPLRISASSEESLVQNARALASYLRQNDHGTLSLADVAFTLNEKRSTLQHSASIEATTIAEAARLLSDLEPSSIVQAPPPLTAQPPAQNQQKASPGKPVVLLFSGQYDDKVSLDRSFYTTFPTFRAHMDAVDAAVRAQGLPGIFPSVFESQPLGGDVATLQCGIFAMQYASAMCWLDGGRLRPNAVVGHSLGELTALAVCGVLSLPDAVRLVAARARMIEDKVTDERGAMLAVSGCSADEFGDLRDVVRDSATTPTPTPQHDIEVACYNAPTELVVAGSSAAIARAEDLVRSDSRFGKMRARRLATSHGFHSRLMDPIIQGTDAVAASLEWREPSIPLYTCTAQPLAAFADYSPSRHAREPVFFADAVRRVEERLGGGGASSGGIVWLEAGVNTPVVPMASKAIRQPPGAQHTFLALKTKTQAGLASDVVAGAVSRLWAQGVPATHWSLLRGCRPVWLPPYQFERTRHWLPNVDRAGEMERKMLAGSAGDAADMARGAGLDSNNVQIPPPRLVTVKSPLSTGSQGGEFAINTQSRRFRAVISGHAVRSRSLCPASLYMECVTMALQQLLGAQGNNDLFQRGAASLVFEHLAISSPLGLDPEGDVLLRLEPDAASSGSWRFTVRTVVSRGGGDSKPPRETSHATGTIALTQTPAFDAFQRLVAGPMARLLKDGPGLGGDADRLGSGRAYGLFRRVVDYAPFFRGIRSATLAGHEAVATVQLPQGGGDGDKQPGRDESTAWKACDTVALDVFVQVVGLLINSHESVGAGDVVVMVGLDRAVVAPGCCCGDVEDAAAARWRVYARFDDSADPNHPVGDVFVCSDDAAQCGGRGAGGGGGGLVAILSGCRFARLPTAKLERTLDLANRGQAPRRTEAEEPVVSPPSSSSSSSAASTPSNSAGSTAESSVATTRQASPSRQPALSDSDAKTVAALRGLMAEYTGIKPPDIPQSATLSELGLDSLASVELAGEFMSRFGLQVSSDDVGGCTLQGLCGKLDIGVQDTPVSDAPGAGLSSAAPAAENDGTVGGPDNGGSEARVQEFGRILASVSSVKPGEIKESDQLADLGIDSLSAMDLKQELEDKLSVRLDDLVIQDTVKDLMGKLGISSSPRAVTGSGSGPKMSKSGTPSTSGAAAPGADGQEEARTVLVQNPFKELRATDSSFDASARRNGFVDYWSDVAPAQDELLLAYIVEAFAKLGVDLRRAAPGDKLASLPHQTPKHDKVVQRLWEILESHQIVSFTPGSSSSENTQMTRGSHVLDVNQRSAAELLSAFRSTFPRYKDEANLIGLTGPKLAECLSGQLDSVSLMFGSPGAMRIMEDYYGQSPMISTLTDQLVILVQNLSRNSATSSSASHPLRILEVGAGTGGTTRRLAAALADARVPVRYTFTDISPSLVSKARNSTPLRQHAAWLDFATFNLERDVPASLRGRFDLVIGTNCVHATSDRTASCRRLRETLAPGGGVVVLSEVTTVIDWYDICFGLLDGWWLAGGGDEYPIQPAGKWMSSFRAAGFASAGFSGGLSREANSQQLLMACDRHWDVPEPVGGPHPPLAAGGGRRVDDGESGGDDTARGVETMVYKEVDGVQVHADVFYPGVPPSSPMPIALMIHGGGHMTLSRRAVRPAQTQYLLANGYLPVSIDYRLCPEVNLIDGPIADVCDAYRWARTSLVQRAAERGVSVDSEKVVAVGWSTGGHLAVSLGWTCEAAGLPPPTAVLSFYSPYDFESGDLDATCLESLSGRKLSLKHIISSLPKRPITNYDNSAQGDTTNLGWVRPGDPRSELVMALFKEGIGLSLLLNGLQKAPTKPQPHTDTDDTDDTQWADVLIRPPPERVAAISPLARLAAGQYSCPTFVVHGTADEVAPFAGAERFVAGLAARGMRHGFLSVPGARHIHDLHLRPGTEGWGAQVEPGYRFLFDVVGGSGVGQE